MRRLLGRVVTGILVVSALGMIGLVVRQQFFPPGMAVRRIEDWSSLSLRGHVIGPADAAVKIVEFSDFQCPYCAGIQESLRQLLAEFQNDLAIVYRHFPIERLHVHAVAAANAAECAGSQGAFVEYHDALYEEQPSIGQASWDEFARRAGLPDPQAFSQCVRDSLFVHIVRQDLETAQRVALRGTPTLIVDGYVLEAASMVELHKRVERAVRNARRQRR